MNRDIKFRGKHSNNWFYGSLLKCIEDNECYITTNMNKFYQVKKETIGQYTGLKDKNGVEIYEGDILTNNVTNSKCIVRFYDARFMLSYVDRLEDVPMYNFINRMSSLFEIIGNIYDELKDSDD